MKTNQTLFLLHLPPPVHGSSIVGKYIYESKVINENINAKYINLLASKTVDDSGNLSIRKILQFTSTATKLIHYLTWNRTDICYFALTTTGFAFFKDVILVAILKLFNVPIIFHIHNKGVSKYANKKIYNKLYSFVFKDTKVIILSTKLYSDISKFVNKNQIEICPNGIPDFK